MLKEPVLCSVLLRFWLLGTLCSAGSELDRMLREVRGTKSKALPVGQPVWVKVGAMQHSMYACSDILKQH